MPSKKQKRSDRPRSQRRQRIKLGSQRLLMSMHNVAALSECEDVYVRALSNPFDPEIRGKVCYPSFPAKNSRKMVGVKTLNITIGTNGVGWLMFDVTPSSTASPVIFYTDGSYAGNTASTMTKTLGSGVTGTHWGTPNQTTEFTESTDGRGNQFRMVAAGMQFRYTGTELTRGGSVFVLTSQQQASLEGFVLGNAADSSLSREFPVVNRYQCAVLPPSHEDDLEWKDGDQIFPWSDGGQTDPKPIAAAIFFGEPGNTFVVRLIEHYEVSGVNFNYGATVSHVGRPELIQTVTSAAAAAAYAPAQNTSYMAQFGNAIKSMTDTPFVRKVGDYVLALGANYVANRFGLGGQAADLLGGSMSRLAIDVD